MNEDLERDLAGTGMLDFAAALRAAPQACVSTGFADGDGSRAGGTDARAAPGLPSPA